VEAKGCLEPKLKKPSSAEEGGLEQGVKLARVHRRQVRFEPVHRDDLFTVAHEDPERLVHGLKYLERPVVQ
jgi:hypothetical protein